jgi:endonuclease G, mitochondrial
LDEYRDSGYDRGHLAPSGDEPDAPWQFQGFAPSNVVPQNPNENRKFRADMGFAVRDLVLAGGDDVYVAAGRIFGPDHPPPRRGWVQVPMLLFKAVYDETAGIAGV